MISIVPIEGLTGSDPNEGGLYAISDSNEDSNCFDQFFERLLNLESTYIIDYLMKHKELLSDEFFEGKSIEDLAFQIRSEARRFQSQLYNACIAHDEGASLKAIFMSLDKSNRSAVVRLNNKVEAREIYVDSIAQTQKPLLRLYALYYGINYVTTGGCIKLTKAIQRPSGYTRELETERQFSRLNFILKILDKNQISTHSFTGEPIELSN